MKAKVNFVGRLSESFTVENGVRQGEFDAPLLFAIYYTVVSSHSFPNSAGGGEIT